MNNLGITISFVIGGLLLLALLTLNARVEQNSGETVLNMSAKQTVDNITQIMRRDFVRMGYNMNDIKDNAIKNFDDDKIRFLTDIDSNADTKATQITWKFTEEKFTASDNPNDCKLIRTGPQGESVFPVVCGSGKFEYPEKDNKGNPISITVSLTTESPEKYGDNENYEKSFFQRTFTPPNIKLNNLGSSYWGNE